MSEKKQSKLHRPKMDIAQTIELKPSLWPLLNLNSDRAYLELRKKYYGEGQFDLNSPSGEILGQFQQLKIPIKRIPTQFISPLAGWESSGWRSYEKWNPSQWDDALAALSHRIKWDIFQSLWHSPSERDSLNQSAEKLNLHVINRIMPLKVIHGFENFDDYLKSFSRKRKDRYKSTVKALEKNQFTVNSNVTYEDIQGLFNRRVLRMSSNDNAKLTRYQSFLKEWVNHLKSIENLEVIGVWHQGELIGMTLGFWREKVFFFNYTAYDPKYRALSPGSIAIYKIIETALNKGAELFSFMGHFEYEKLYSWQDLECHRVDIFSKSLKAQFLYRLMKYKADRPN